MMFIVRHTGSDTTIIMLDMIYYDIKSHNNCNMYVHIVMYHDNKKYNLFGTKKT